MTRPRPRLDEFAPQWQFNEVHSQIVKASASRVYRAIKQVTAREIRFFRSLVWLRRLGRSGPEGILNPPADVALLGCATRTGFVLLADEPDREVVVGTVIIVPPGVARPHDVERFRSVTGPGFAKAMMSFGIEERGSAVCLVSTETRVHATDARTTRRFRVYWWLIRPLSGLIRRMWLRAIKRRAEAV